MQLRSVTPSRAPPAHQFHTYRSTGYGYVVVEAQLVAELDWHFCVVAVVSHLDFGCA